MTYSHVQMLQKIAHRHQFHRLDPRGVHSSDKTRRKPHGVRASGVLERQFLRSRNDDKNLVIFKIIGFLFL